MLLLMLHPSSSMTSWASTLPSKRESKLVMLMVSLVVLNSNAATDATFLFLNDIMGIDIAIYPVMTTCGVACGRASHGLGHPLLSMFLYGVTRSINCKKALVRISLTAMLLLTLRPSSLMTSWASTLPSVL